MRTGFGIIALMLAGIAPSAFAAAVLAGPLYEPTTGHKYYLLPQNTWTASETEAMALGGHLATIDDAAENNFVTSQFNLFGGISRGLWIGLNDAQVEGNLVWAAGDASAYRNWSPLEPNGSTPGSDYTLIYPPSTPVSGRWDDAENKDSWGYLNATFPLHGVVEVLPEPAAALSAAGVLLVTARRTRRHPQA